ncbi:DUF4412 domain-containing protein [Prosthecochloris sp. N3]|uniref:DUF4412 domain-containing protein n=1 Tax=Prosthecochloris ethylica TaxID=2743976 RepID=A0ABR9XNT6_9CHLB|nr:DUF4412 domain-containing protein [Prosthecochloris ethylica]MBF0585720.1 DUF4412 domain-containing protein [Prosthecochloris ethylica]MBF0635630.1 DUF4412 domain-containing protein [Prosthecochloris ethylica]NUK46929.1 DUF4412 domain-containing protein [Prosthecochloris ethylica]
MVKRIAVVLIALFQLSILPGCQQNDTGTPTPSSGGLFDTTFEGILDMQITSPEGSQSGRMLLSDRGTRFEMTIMDPESGNTVMNIVTIAPADEPDLIYTVNDEQKTYSVIDLGKLEEELDPLVGEEADPDVTVEKLGTETILGYKCSHVSITDSNGTTELWLTKDLLSASDISRLQVGSSRQKDMFASRMKEAGLEGFPLKSLDRQSGTTMEITNIEKTSLDSALFEVPEGYTKQEFAVMPELTEEQKQQMEQLEEMMSEENMQQMQEMMNNMQEQFKDMQLPNQ